MWMLSSSKPRSFNSVFGNLHDVGLGLHCSVDCNELRTTSTVSFLCSRPVLLILWLSKASQSRISFPAKYFVNIMPLNLLPSCTRRDVLNFLEHFCSLLLQSNHSAICTAWSLFHCAFAAPSIQYAHARVMVCTRHVFSVRLACTLILPLQAGILQSPLSILFFSSTSSWTSSFVSKLLPLYLLSMMHRRPPWAMTHLPSNRS